MHRNGHFGMLAMKHNRSAHSGFTLLELMVTAAVAAVLMAVAAPSFISFQRNAELTTFANTMLSAVNTARSEAMKHGQHAMVIPAGTTGWGSGWIVFVDVNRNDVFDTSSDILVMNRDAPAAYLTVAGTDGTAALTSPAVPYVMFDASGYAKTKAAAFESSGLEFKRNDVAADQELAHTRRLLIDRSGRARVCKPATSSDAQCPARN